MDGCKRSVTDDYQTRPWNTWLSLSVIIIMAKNAGKTNGNCSSGLHLGEPSSQYNLEVSDTELAVLIEESRIFINSICINKSEHS